MARSTTLDRFQARIAEPPDDEDGGDGEGEPTAFAVPDDIAFTGRFYLDAPELERIARDLIARHPSFAEIGACEIQYFWRRKTGVSAGRVTIGLLKRASDLLGHFSGADYILWLSATTARDGKFSARQVEAAVFHQLCHISTDDHGNYIKLPHDFEGFAREITEYGPWTSDLVAGGRAFLAARQLDLFDDDEDEDDE